MSEVYLLDEAAIARYYGHGDELHLSFNFSFLWAAPTASSLRERIARTLEHLTPIGAWPTWVLSNHDVVRHRQRHGGSETLARQMAVLLLTLPGTPFLYQGEELGLLDADVPPERVVDPGRRDGCRAPMPWTGDPLHGWPADPWLPFAPEVDERNVAALVERPESILHLYRRLIALRRTTDALLSGGIELFGAGDEVLAYRRGDDVEVVIVLGDVPAELDHEIEVLAASDAAAPGERLRAVTPGRAVVGRRVGSTPTA